MLIRTSVCSALHFRRLGIVNCATLLLIIILATGCKAQSFNDTAHVVTGAERTSEYLPALKGKNVAIVANPTSQINGTHLVDSLISLKVKVKLVFAPEHGFRGEAEAGEHV
ncbi:MAG TPA: DUF1343 domain-containing protein, partial [Bacteroidia bacterium]|nr:DUF1343 domain-containing protein [Bacteroidia bacterium]